MIQTEYDKTFSESMTKFEDVTAKLTHKMGKSAGLLQHVAVTLNARDMKLDAVDLSDIELLIQGAINIGRVMVIDSGIMLAHVKRKYFNGDDGTWKKWAVPLTGWEERRCYMMASIGAMFLELPSDYYQRHKLTDSVKLDIVAQCTDEAQLEWLSDDRICCMSRERLRVELALLRKNGVKTAHIAKVREIQDVLPGFEDLIQTVGVKGSKGIDCVAKRISDSQVACKIKETGVNCLMASVAYLAEDPAQRAEVLQTVKELESLCETLRTSLNGTVMTQITA